MNVFDNIYYICFVYRNNNYICYILGHLFLNDNKRSNNPTTTDFLLLWFVALLVAVAVLLGCRIFQPHNLTMNLLILELSTPEFIVKTFNVKSSWLNRSWFNAWNFHAWSFHAWKVHGKEFNWRVQSSWRVHGLRVYG